MDMIKKGRKFGASGQGPIGGGLSETKPADASSRDVAEAVKTKVLQHLQSSNTAQNIYEVISYATQVVAGTVYILKIKINTNPPTFIHVKVLRQLDGTKELSGVETSHTENDSVDLF